MQKQLLEIFTEAEYSTAEAAELLGITTKYLERHTKRLNCYGRKIATEDLIRFLMGGKMY